jgi:hypothetical protein
MDRFLETFRQPVGLNNTVIPPPSAPNASDRRRLTLSHAAQSRHGGRLRTRPALADSFRYQVESKQTVSAMQINFRLSTGRKNPPSSAPNSSPTALIWVAIWAYWDVAYSHSIVAGGLEEMSYTTRLTPLTSLMIRLLIVASTSYGRRAQSAVMKSWLSTARMAITLS